MRTDNRKVAENWAKGIESSSWTGNLSTDGKYLFSYNLVIGWTTPEGIKIATLYNAPNNAFESQTTSTHVSYAVREADESQLPLGQRLTKRSLLNKKY